jgi:hypothetical protein
MSPHTAQRCSNWSKMVGNDPPRLPGCAQEHAGWIQPEKQRVLTKFWPIISRLGVIPRRLAAIVMLTTLTAPCCATNKIRVRIAAHKNGPEPSSIASSILFPIRGADEAGRGAGRDCAATGLISSAPAS